VEHGRKESNPQRAALDAGPGEITSLPPGHDAWVVGDEPVVAIDWQRR
jgi:hypothetical protein